MHNRLRAVITLVAAGAVLLAGTSTPGYATTFAEGATVSVPSRVTAAAEYGGEAIFTGLFLSYGPVADRYPELVAGGINMEPGTSPDVAELVAEITKAVDTRDPAFFDDLERAVTSGDRVRVDQALRAGQEMLATVLTEDMDATIARIGDAQVGIVLLIFIVLAAAATVGVVVNAVVGVNVAANINRVINLARADSVAAIDHERWVDEVAGAFASA
jgi:SdpC family antimicrobial peptide